MPNQNSPARTAMMQRAQELRDREQNPTQGDFVTVAWLNTPEGRKAVEAAQRLQAQRRAFSELRATEDALGITD